MRSKLEPRTSCVAWNGNACVFLDQTLLPFEEKYITVTDYRKVVDAIKVLAIRGAPAIGIAGAYAAALAANENMTQPDFEKALIEIENARPTAVNLRWAIEEVRKVPRNEIIKTALRIHEEDILNNAKIANFGSEAIPKHNGILTYCNTGDLATGGIGTAFGVIRQAYEDKKISEAYTCETRPVLQGLRLTSWELYKNNIPFGSICDNMAALVIRDGKVGSIVTGADRIARNGDSANKVGTYTLALLAKHHHIPFFIVAPTSTFDPRAKTGADIPIEQRKSEEITGILGSKPLPYSIATFNPSFDVTPHELITGIICEKGVLNPNGKDLWDML